MKGSSVRVTQIASGMYLVAHEGRHDIVYVAGTAADRWIFWNGRVFRSDTRDRRPLENSADPQHVGPHSVAQISLTAPMPARVSRITVEAGVRVKKGDTIIVLEAMKMELPVRAPGEATVVAVHCREGELVQADAALIDLR